MTNKVAIIITNYNMPERADALAEYIKRGSKTPYDLFLVDNGSNLKEPPVHTTHRLGINVQTTGGWLYGLECADRTGEDYFAYWFLITSAEFVGNVDPLTPLIDLLEKNPTAVGVHPALTNDSTTAWTHMKRQKESGYRQTWMVDNIASLYRADWFNSIGRFDPKLVYAWGIDLETCWLARKQDRTIWICEDYTIKKVSDIGYSMNRMNMSSDDRQTKATENMNFILAYKYGDDWYKMLTEAYVTEEMK